MLAFPTRAVRSTVALALALACGCRDKGGTTAGGPAPTVADVEKVLRASWDKAPGTYQPKVTLTVNSCRFGNAYPATAQQVQVEGVPAGETVTPAVVDFTVRTFYTPQVRAMHMVRDATVYHNHMGEWAVVTGVPQTEDTATMEPATPAK